MKIELTRTDLNYLVKALKNQEPRNRTTDDKIANIIQNALDRPRYCYTPLYVENSVGRVDFGTHGYTPTNLSCDDSNDSEKTAKAMNEALGVDEITAYAMTICSMSKAPNAWDNFDEMLEQMKERASNRVQLDD